MAIFTLLAAAALAQAAPAGWTHAVPVAHGDGRATATYRAVPDISTRQIGMTAGTRPSSVRCTWTAEIAVERALVHPGTGASSVRQLAAPKTFKGSRPGDCTANRQNIESDIAARSDAINAHLVRVAEADQRDLRAEIDTLAPPTGR
jgi:hypothetical protein